MGDFEKPQNFHNSINIKVEKKVDGKGANIKAKRKRGINMRVKRKKEANVKVIK